MDVMIMPGKLKGAVTVPPSKSYAVRALVCAALAGGESNISPYYSSRDIDACIRGIGALGARCRFSGDGLAVSGINLSHIYQLDNGRLFACDESATVLRFLIPASLLLGGGFFRGEQRLLYRPIDPYMQLFAAKGIDMRISDAMLSVKGRLEPGLYELPGNISSQFVSGMLMVLPLLNGDSELRITTELSGKTYIDMTLFIMRQFGVVVEAEGYQSFKIKGPQKYKPNNLFIEGDHSHAAFFLAANACGSKVECVGTLPDSLQGDRAMTAILKLMDEDDNLYLDIDETPDLLPPLAVAAALRDGRKTTFLNLARTRIKESDRLVSISNELRKMGAMLSAGKDFLQAEGISCLSGGHVSSWGDHRIAMALSIAATCCQQPLIIEGADCVNKSYPSFFDDFRGLGGNFSWI